MGVTCVMPPCATTADTATGIWVPITPDCGAIGTQNGVPERVTAAR